MVYALVEYARASGDPGALRHALDLFRTIQRHCHDATHGGWGEHYERDWRFIARQDDRIEVEVAGLKSANAHLHWMEALAELCEATRDDDVRRALAEALRLNATHFYPPEAGKACFHRNPDWSFVADQAQVFRTATTSEFAWLMIRAEKCSSETLVADPGTIPDTLSNTATITSAAGSTTTGVGGNPPTTPTRCGGASRNDGGPDRRLAASSVSDYAAALEQLVGFLDTHQVGEDGIWLRNVKRRGQAQTAKAHLEGELPMSAPS